MPPTDPFDPAEPSAGQPDAFDFDLIDIGVAGDGGAANRPQVRAPREQGGRSPVRVLAALVAVVAVAALLVGLFSGEDQAAESPLPSPTVPPEVLGDPARPAPTATVQVPVVSDGLLRAGETCRISLDDDGTQVVFTVPDGRTMRDCASAGTLLRDPGSDEADLLGSVRFSPQPLGLTLKQFRGDEPARNHQTEIPLCDAVACELLLQPTPSFSVRLIADLNVLDHKLLCQPDRTVGYV